MNVSGPCNSLKAQSVQYNFKSMTNDEFLATVQKLGTEGEVTQSDADQLAFIAQGVDSVPIGGASPSVTEILSNPTKHDFISELQGDDDGAHKGGGTGSTLYDRLLESLKDVQVGDRT